MACRVCFDICRLCLSLQPNYTVYISIGYSKERAEEDTQLITSSSHSHACLCGGDQLQVWVGVPSSGFAILRTFTRRHIEVQAFILILAYSIWEFHFHHCQHTKMHASAWNMIKKFGSCIVHHACSTSLCSSCQS